MASKNDVAISWAWVSLLGRRPVGSIVPPEFRAPEDGLPAQGDGSETFEEDFRIVSLTWSGPIQ